MPISPTPKIVSFSAGGFLLLVFALTGLGGAAGALMALSVVSGGIWP